MTTRSRLYSILISALLLSPVSGSKAESGAPISGLTGPYLGQTEPGDTALEFAPDLIPSPDGYHSALIFSPDGNTACWTGMSKNTYVSYQIEGVWSSPVPVEIESEYGIGEPVFSSDGQRLYFICRRPPKNDLVNRERIWFADRNDSGWSEARLLDEKIARHPTHWQFSLSDSGNLYFTSEIEGVRGHQDVFVARREDDRYLEPESLGSAINSDVRDFCPFVAPDESYLLFSRSVPEERNRSDLFISFRDSTGSWGEAVNLGDRINSLQNEVCPTVSPDGRFLFFARAGNGPNRIYWVSTDFIERLRLRR